MLGEDGTLYEGFASVLCDEDVEMVRQGYKCISCDEVCPDGGEAFPVKCWLCSFPMRELQASEFAKRYQGWTPTGTSIDWDAEEERLERQRHEREVAEGLRSRGIVLPRSV